MKLRSLHAFLPLALLSLSQPARALTSETYNYGFGSVPIPDGNPAGFANAQTIASSINVITKLTVQLNLSSGYNGDLYAYLRHTTPGGTGFSVLLNRVGSTSSNSFGYSDAGFDVTLADAAANGDVHVYQGTLDPAGSALTGTWAPDGRNIDPDLSLDTTTRTALLGSFNGLSALGEWTLFLADVSGGAVSNLNSWGMTIDGLSGSFYWKGGNGGVWNAVSAGSSNWAADAAGTTPILAVPDPNADVIFSANGATDLNTILGADLTIRSLTVNDSAAVTIGGPNTLTISGPTGLTVNSGAGFLSINSNLTLAGTSNTVTVDNSAGTIINGILGGTIGLTKAGSGTLFLGNSANNYTGRTKISDGVLSVSVIANGGTTSCIGTSSSAASNLLFDGGTLQYTGTTASTDRNFSISDGKTAAFDITHGASDLTISGKVVTTTGGLSKTGLGTLTLSGSNAYTGTTSLLAGTLAAANKKALGSGNLTITGGTLQTAGGNRIIHLGDGNLSQDGGTIALTVGGPAAGLQSDLIKTRGTAAFNSGTLALTQASGHELLPGEKIRLVTADGGLTVGGATPPSTGTRLLAITVMGAEDFSNNPLLIAQVNAYRKSLVLEAAQGSFADLAGPFGFTPNQLAVARSLDSVAALHQNKTGLVSVLDILDTQPLDTLPASLDLIAPDELTSIFTLGTSLSGIQFSNLMGFMASIRDPEHSAKDAKGAIQSDERWETFLLASGSAASADSTSNASGFDLDTGGTTAGAGYRINDRIMIGGDVGYSETTASLVGRGRVRAEEWQLGLFGTYHDGGFHVDAAIGGGINHYKTHRDSLGGSASAEPDGSAFDLMLQTGYDWKFGPLTAGPTASVQYSDTRVSSFTEKGGLTPLDIHSEDGESIRSALGGRAFYDTKIAGLAIRPELHASWQHEYGDTSYSLTSEFDTLGGAPFTVHGPELGRDSLLLGVGISVLYNERISSFISYDGELFRSNYSSNSISAGVRASF